MTVKLINTGAIKRQNPGHIEKIESVSTHYSPKSTVFLTGTVLEKLCTRKFGELVSKAVNIKLADYTVVDLASDVDIIYYKTSTLQSA